MFVGLCLLHEGDEGRDLKSLVFVAFPLPESQAQHKHWVCVVNAPRALYQEISFSVPTWLLRWGVNSGSEFRQVTLLL